MFTVRSHIGYSERMNEVTYPDNRPALSAWGICAAFIFAAVALISVLQWRAPDYGTVHLVNSAAQRSVLLDHLFGNLSREMLSNLLIVSLLWAAWFERPAQRARAVLLTGVAAAMVASVISRALQLALPSHPRPLHDPALRFRIPLAVNPEGLNHWSSFPSDHAALFFGLAIAIFFVHRTLGTLALVITVIINFARIYLGFHFPSDVIGGGMLGILIVVLAHSLSRRAFVERLAVADRRHPGWFYGIAMYLSFGIVTLMQDYRDIASGLAHYLHHHAP